MKRFPRCYYMSFLQVQFLLFFLSLFFRRRNFSSLSPFSLSILPVPLSPRPRESARSSQEKLAAPEVFIDSASCEGKEEVASGPLKRNSVRGEERREERLISVIEIRRAFANTSGGAVNARVIGSRAAKESRPVYIYIYIYIYIYRSSEHCVQLSIGRRNFSETTHARRYIPRAYAYVCVCAYPEKEIG